MNNSTTVGSPVAENGLTGQLLPALVQCFSVIFFGYLAGKFEMITPAQSKGIGIYISKFALPAIFFKVMVTVDFSSISWEFLIALSVSKVAIFAIVFFVIIATVRPLNFGLAGIATVFCTLTNDVALGYPILITLFPDYAVYVYLVAPIQLVVLSPISFLLMEWQTLKDERQDAIKGAKDKCDITSASNKRDGLRARLLLVIRNVMMNPLVFMTLVGTILNFLLSRQLPIYVSKVLDIFAVSFSATALFFLGLGMVSKMSNIDRHGVCVLVFLLSIKLIFMPFLTREFVSLLQPGHGSHKASVDFSTVGFLYGVLPPAPTVFLFSAQYQLMPDVIASGLVLATFICAPIMFVTAHFITIDMVDGIHVQETLRNTSVTVSYISLFCVIFVLFLMFLGGKLTKLPQQLIAILQLFIFLCNLGLILNVFIVRGSDNPYGAVSVTRTALFALFFVGVSGTRFWTSIIAISLVLLKWKGLPFLKQWVLILYAAGLFLPLSLSGCLLFFSGTPEPSEPIFHFGRMQMFLSACILFANILVTLVCLIFFARLSHTTSGPMNYIPVSDDSIVGSKESLASSTASDTNCTKDINTGVKLRNRSAKNASELTTREIMGSELVEAPVDELQLYRHITLLIFLLITMFFGLSLCLWRLVREDKSGLYLGLEYLDSVFYFGQGFIVLCIFGLELNLIVIPIRNVIHRLFGSENVKDLPSEDVLDEEVLNTRREFLHKHYHGCRSDIVSNRRVRLFLYRNVFSPRDLIDWLTNNGVVQTREEAEEYGVRLLHGRVIYHLFGKPFFCDHSKPYFRFNDLLPYVHFSK